MTIRFVILGNPENRRVSMFSEALARRDLPPPTVIAWRDLVQGTHALDQLPDTPAFVRIDSFGESFDLDRALLRRGYADAADAGVEVVPLDEVDELQDDRGRILAPRQLHLGFLRVLGDVEAALARKTNWRLLNPPSSIRELFDKRVTSRKYHSLGIPVPAFFDDVDSSDALRAAMRDRGCRQVYVKLSCSSSASCLAIFDTTRGRESITTTIEMAETGWYNSLRVRRYEKRAAIEAILRYLLREGSQIEEGVPKARINSNYFDTRVLVIAGEPAFTVVRQQERHPITNLHLGGSRGNLDDLRRLVPSDVYDEAMKSCQRVFEAHDCLHVGIDLMYEADLSGHRVIEANAFGDLLPNLSRDGLSVYEYEIEKVKAMAQTL